MGMLDMTNLLEVRDLTKTFPGQVALDNFDIVLGAGRTHALVGQNGSGKSTFIKILAGYHQPDPGWSATLAGTPLHLGDGGEARAAGVRFVHQDLGLVDSMSAVENISMGVGYTTRRGGRIDWRADTARAHDELEALGFHDINVMVPVGALAPSQRTAVAVARSMHGWEENAHLLVLDEPTATLPGADVERLFTAIRLMKERGVAILYVSHHIDEVFAIADDVSVLRDGKRVATSATADLDHERLIELMIGHRLERSERASQSLLYRLDRGGLQVVGLRGGPITGIDLHVRPGEIVGVAGITGSGREALAKLITGQTPSDGGDVFVSDQPIPNYAPRESIRAGMAFVPADRGSQGIIPQASVTHNMTLADVKRNWRGWRLRHRDETSECVEMIDRLRIKTSSPASPITALSGGNQQKVLFGRSLRLAPAVLVLDEPTAGIDVSAKEQILTLIDQAAQDGAAVLMVSTDTDELVQVAHRIIIMVGGSIAAELSGADMTPENVERAQLQTLKDVSR
jgi:ribose transport system ATP-binding protein